MVVLLKLFHGIIPSNVKNVNILWPTPIEFEILGLKSLGYQNNVIFPLEVEIDRCVNRIHF